MQLQLLDFDKYIEKNKILQVKSYKIPSNSYDEDGLWSEIIFGQVGSNSRLTKFGYVDLKNKYIHPGLFDMISTVSESTSKLIRNKGFYIVEDGRYIESSNGQTGLEFLIKTIKDIEFSKICHKHKKEIAKYLDKTEILISKFLIQPAGLRDIDIYSKGNARMNIDEINNLYTKLLIYIEQLSGVDELDDFVNKKIQLQLNAIYDFIQDNRLKGKKGLFRGTMLRKTMDYSTRLVLTNDPDVPLGKVGLPWHTLSSIFEPFMIHYIFKRNENEENIDVLRKYTNNEKLDHLSFSKLNREITNNPDIVPEEVKAIFVDTLEQFLPDQVVMVKRDPVQQRNSWFSAIPIIMEGRVAYVNSLDLGPLGGDCVKGDVITYTKNENDEFIKNIEPIDKFYENHELELINKYYKGDVEVYDFLVKDEVYSLGINEQTGSLQYSRIQRWSIHNNIKLTSMIIDDSVVNISKTNSCYVYNNLDNDFNKLDVDELYSDQDLSFIKVNEDYTLSFINTESVIFTDYINDDLVNINIGDIIINTVENKVAYDFTMEEIYIRSFLHSSMIVQCNSDGDTVAVLPVFTEEAKKEVSEKMSPTNNKNKWVSPLSYNNIIYAPSLDTISSIYNATRS